MKKVLIASTALVAAGLLTTGTASASEKIKLNLGGFSKWYVVGAWNDDSYQSNAGAVGTQADYNSVDIKGNNEIFFGGSTTLDNGLKVGIDIQLEAGGHTDQTTDTIDESYVWVEGGFGKFIIGTENNGAYLLHVSAPDAAGNWNEDGIITGNQSLATAGVTGLLGGNTTAIATDGDADKITYVAPSFYGLTVGASYVPSSSQDNRNATNIRAETTGEIYGVGALYANTFGGVGVKVSAGWVTYDFNTVTGTTTGLNEGKDSVDEFSAGTQLSYAGFTLGGSFRRQAASDRGNANNGYGWDVGLQYASGPYAVSASYFKSQVQGAATTGEDKIEIYQASGKYNLGAGVDALLTIGHASYDDETGLQQNENDGWVVATGLSLAF